MLHNLEWFCLLGTLSNVWGHLWLSPLGCSWHQEGGGQGCCSIPYSAQDDPPTEMTQPVSPVPWGGGSPGLVKPYLVNYENTYRLQCTLAVLLCPSAGALFDPHSLQGGLDRGSRPRLRRNHRFLREQGHLWPPLHPSP